MKNRNAWIRAKFAPVPIYDREKENLKNLESAKNDLQKHDAKNIFFKPGTDPEVIKWATEHRSKTRRVILQRIEFLTNNL